MCCNTACTSCRIKHLAGSLDGPSWLVTKQPSMRVRTTEASRTARSTGAAMSSSTCAASTGEGDINTDCHETPHVDRVSHTCGSTPGSAFESYQNSSAIQHHCANAGEQEVLCCRRAFAGEQEGKLDLAQEPSSAQDETLKCQVLDISFDCQKIMHSCQ